MGGKRKNTAEGKTPLQQGRSGHKSVAKVLAGGAVAVAGAKGEVVKLLDSDVPKTVLRCDECHGTLKPPVYQCSRLLHIACGDCSGGDDHEYECSSCTYSASSAVYVQSSYLDTLFGYTKVACPYKKYGCASTFALCDATAHAGACVFAPCMCPEFSFEGSPADLVRHLTEESGGHGWTAHKIAYGKDHRYVLDGLESLDVCRILLIAEEDDGVFVLDIDCPVDYNFVALFCVRNKAGSWPVYSSSVTVEGPPAKGVTVKVENKAVPSCPPTEILGALCCESVAVHPELLRWEGEHTKKLHLCICISKAQRTSA